MLIKGLKIIGIIFSVFFVLLTLLYIFGPYLVKNRFASDAVKTSTDKSKQYLREDSLPENGRILFVGAHPDDLEFMSGGTLPLLLERGNQVYLVILTNGGKQRYMPGFYSRAIIKTRREDQIKIAKEEGLKKVFFGNYNDGSLKYSDEAFEKVDKIAFDYGITDIFTFESGKRNGYYDSDHDVAGRIGTAVSKHGKNVIKGLYYFRASDPNLIVDITKTFQAKLDTMFMFTEFRYKHRMLKAMHEAMAGADGSRIGVKYGETYRYLDLISKKQRQVEKIRGRVSGWAFDENDDRTGLSATI
ncbi:MAG: PIG-L family deacetylase [Rubrobacteridae bacterium]|nr:PIG-L family deacetylase [Rubrobacteridae bacterium]